jgi:hypothetical protein
VHAAVLLRIQPILVGERPNKCDCLDGWVQAVSQVERSGGSSFYDYWRHSYSPTFARGYSDSEVGDWSWKCLIPKADIRWMWCVEVVWNKLQTLCWQISQSGPW